MDSWASSNRVTLEYRPSSRSRSVLVERFHRTLRDTLNSFTTSPSSWSFFLQNAIQAMNTQISDAHGFQPSYLYSGHLTDPIEGPAIDQSSSHSFNLRVAKAVINFKKKNLSSDYKYRVLQADQKVNIKYDHTKSGTTLMGTVITDLGENHSTVLVKLNGRHLPIKIHKTDIMIPKSDPNYSLIFSDLPHTLLPNVSRQLTE